LGHGRSYLPARAQFWVCITSYPRIALHLSGAEEVEEAEEVEAVVL
jgi:hypothetical protein